MNDPDESELRPAAGRVAPTYPVIMIVASLAAIVLTYLLANSSWEVVAKTRGFSSIIGAFLALSAVFYFWQSRQQSSAAAVFITETPETEIDRGLEALDEANQFFTGALKSSDTFRLVANRVRGLAPFQSAVLLLLDPTRSNLTITEAEGYGVKDQKSKIVSFDDSLAAHSYHSQKVEFGDETVSANEHASPSVAIPLIRGMEVFGVLQLYFERGYDLEKAGHSLFEAVGTRVSPLILSSIAFERSQVNALTDATTDLPNERAFYLILENQIAEAMRKRDDRPLTILTIDVKDFDQINQKFGHAAGDQVLNFVAQVVKDNLRQMDFFARSMSDEFLAILPTASKEISHEIVSRIHTGFFGRKLKLSDTDSIEIEVNFGWAAFGEDGETADHLLAAARQRKEQSKSVVPNKVLWFQKELVN